MCSLENIAKSCRNVNFKGKIIKNVSVFHEREHKRRDITEKIYQSLSRSSLEHFPCQAYLLRASLIINPRFSPICFFSFHLLFPFFVFIRQV